MAGQIVQDARAARVDEVEVQVGGVPAVPAGEFGEDGGEWFHGAGDPLVQQEVEAGRTDAVRDPVLGVRYEVGGVGLQPDAGTAGAADDGRGHRIAEQAVGQQGSDAEVGGLVAQRAEFAGDDERVGARVGGAEVVRPVDGAAARGAAELGDGELPRAGPEAEGIDQPGGQGRHHEAGAGDVDDQVDVTCRQFRVDEGLLDDLRDAPLGLGLVHLVAGLEPRVAQDLLDRPDQVAFDDPGVLDQT